MEYISHFFSSKKEGRKKEEVKKEGRNYNEKKEIVITELNNGSGTPSFTIYINETQYQQYIRNMIVLASKEPIIKENTHSFLASSGNHKFYVSTTTDTLLRCLNPEIKIEDVLKEKHKESKEEVEPQQVIQTHNEQQVEDNGAAKSYSHHIEEVNKKKNKRKNRRKNKRKNKEIKVISPKITSDDMVMESHSNYDRMGVSQFFSEH